MREPDWRARAEALLDEVTALTARARRHADGRAWRRPAARAAARARVAAPRRVARFAAVKHAFDPGGNPQSRREDRRRGQRALDDVKYDPALPPLPEPARAALSRVERERAYARSRLALLDEANTDSTPRPGDA